MGKGRTNAKSRQPAASTKKNDQNTSKNDEPLINFNSEAESSSSDSEKTVNNNGKVATRPPPGTSGNVNVFPVKKTWKSTSLPPLLQKFLQLLSKIIQLRVPKTLRSRSQGLLYQTQLINLILIRKINLVLILLN